MRFILAILVCTFAWGEQAANPGKNPFGDRPQAVDAGKVRFAESCSACHGANAEGGRGPNLEQSDRVRHMTDAELFDTIRGGIPGSDMPAFPLPDNTIWELSAFLRSLSTPAFLVPVTGDVDAGKKVYQREQCNSCHMIEGHGGFLGPDLTDVGTLATVKQLKQSVVAPDERPLDGFAGINITLSSGRRISGIAKNSSNYSIEVLDENGKLHLLDKSQIQAVEFSRKSLMPSYANMPQQDLQNLISFLSRLSTRPIAQLDQKPAATEAH